MKGKDNSPPLAGNPPPSVAEDTGNLLCQKDTTLAHIQLGEHRGLPGLSLLSSFQYCWPHLNSA